MSTSPAPKLYTFNRKVVIIMAAILATSAVGTTFAMMVSESPQFLSKIKALAGGIYHHYLLRPKILIHHIYNNNKVTGSLY
jgi:hypothetical protein